MVGGRPAGFSDEDEDSDDCFFDAPIKRNPVRYTAHQHVEVKMKTEEKFKAAVARGDLETVKTMLQTELKRVDYVFHSGWTPVVYAASFAEPEILQYLLDKGANLNSHVDSLTPLMVLCSTEVNNMERVMQVLDILLKNNVLINIGDKYGQTPLMKAITDGKIQIVRELMNQKVNIEMKDMQGWSALFWAVYHNRPDIVQLLMDAGANVNDTDRQMRVPLDIAFAHGHQQLIELLEPQEEEEEPCYTLQMADVGWHESFPDIIYNGPAYASEIPHLLYGMHCEQLTPLFQRLNTDLRTFLLLEEKDMVAIGINYVYMRKRLALGLYKFHMKPWKMDAVSGLFALKMDNFDVVDCVNNVGSLLRSVYILDTSLSYYMRGLGRCDTTHKFESPASPANKDVANVAYSVIQNTHGIRQEIEDLRKVIHKLSKNNPRPADLISARTLSGGRRCALLASLMSASLLVLLARTFLPRLTCQLLTRK